MYKRWRRWAALLLVLAMSLSLVPPAAAEGPERTPKAGNTVVLNGSTYEVSLGEAVNWWDSETETSFLKYQPSDVEQGIVSEDEQTCWDYYVLLYDFEQDKEAPQEDYTCIADHGSGSPLDRSHKQGGEEYPNGIQSSHKGHHNAVGTHLSREAMDILSVHAHSLRGPGNCRNTAADYQRPKLDRLCLHTTINCKIIGRTHDSVLITIFCMLSEDIKQKHQQKRNQYREKCSAYMALPKRRAWPTPRSLAYAPAAPRW